ncbi:MAG: group 1 truncated hemoglobin [Alphaproteobacteria bacterium]|nr:group 1 truncated hemoglobin [Alphaproteobacteria bacterium]
MLVKARFGLLSALILIGGCQAAPVQPSLYDRLGGQPAIVAVVADFVANVAQDTAINKRFQGIDLAKLKRLLVEQVCEAAGGPCKYTGRDMKTAHKGMDISDADFNAMAGDMSKTLAKFRVPDRESSEVMALLGSMRRDIVGQ